MSDCPKHQWYSVQQPCPSCEEAMNITGLLSGGGTTPTTQSREAELAKALQWALDRLPACVAMPTSHDFNQYEKYRVLASTTPAPVGDESPSLANARMSDDEILAWYESLERATCNTESPEQGIIVHVRELLANAWREGADKMQKACEKIVLDEIATSTGPNGGWIDSPKAVCAALVRRLRIATILAQHRKGPDEKS